MARYDNLVTNRTPKKSKYKNIRVTIDGYKFDSKAEAKRYEELKLLQKAGTISDLVIHPRYSMCPAVAWNGRKYPAITYTADFSYIEGGRLVVEDVKGMQTPVYRLKRHWFVWQHPNVDFREIRKGRR